MLPFLNFYFVWLITCFLKTNLNFIRIFADIQRTFFQLFRASAMAVEIGQKIPNFTLTDYEGNKKSLEDFKGKNVVLAFYPAAFTGVCTKEMCTFQDAQSNYENLNAEVLGVSVDSRFSNQAFAQQHGIKFPMLSDYSRETVKSLGINHDDFAGMPGYTAAKRSVFVLDGEGTLQYKWVAENPGQEPNYDEVMNAVRDLRSKL